MDPFAAELARFGGHCAGGDFALLLALHCRMVRRNGIRVILVLICVASST